MSAASLTPSPDLKSQLGLSLGMLLIVLPIGIGHLTFDIQTLGFALVCGGAALLVQIQLTALLKPPHWLRWLCIPALIVSPASMVIGLPTPISIVVPLFALAWVLNGTLWPKVPLWGRFIILSTFGWALLSIDHVTPDFGFPRMPSTSFLWMVIAVVAPLAIATQPGLRNFARAVVLTEVMLVFLALSLTPLVLQVFTGFKEVGEPERNFFSLDPLPGFESVPDPENGTWIPSDFQRFKDPIVALRVLDHMNQALQLDELKTISGSYDPDQAIFLLQQFGLLQKDRYGFYPSPRIYGTYDTPENMDPAFRSVITSLAHHTSFDITDEETINTLTTNTSLPATEKAFRTLMLRLRGLNLVDTIPENASVFRMTPQARHRLGNGLFPRQILFALEQSADESPSRLHHKDYAPEWNLSFEGARSELIELVDAGALQVDEDLTFYPYTPEGLSIWPVTLSVFMAWCGLVLTGISQDMTRPQRIRLASFALGIVCVTVGSSLPGLEAPLVHQAVWATFWMPVSALLYGIALR